MAEKAIVRPEGGAACALPAPGWYGELSFAGDGPVFARVLGAQTWLVLPQSGSGMFAQIDDGGVRVAAWVHAPVLHLARRRPVAPMVLATSKAANTAPAATAPASALTPLPSGVEELKFAEFYKTPVGPRGLEPGERLKGLDGKKVRLSGFFVFEDWSTCSCTPTTAPAANGRHVTMTPGWMKHVIPGRAMLAPVPTAVSLGHYDLCDDLPPQVAYLHIASHFGEPVYYQPGYFTVTGTLGLGNKNEPDGRISFVRLLVEGDADIVRVGQ